MRALNRTTQPRAAGFSLVEALVATVVAALAASAVLSLFVHQAAIGAAVLVHAAARAQWAEARAALNGDLTALAAGSARLVTAQDSLVELEAHVGVALACAGSAAGGHTLVVTHAGVTGLVATDGWSRAVATGDSLFAFDESLGAWVGGEITGSAKANCASGLLAGPGRMIVIAAPGFATRVGVGTPVHVRRRVRWSTYRSSDGSWYLGIRERTQGAWATVQPAAGPLDAHNGRPRPFLLLDAAGTAIAPPVSVVGSARLEVRLAMQGDHPADRTALVAPIRWRP